MINITLLVAVGIGLLLFLFAKNISSKKKDSVKTGGAIIGILALALLIFSPATIPDYIMGSSVASVGSDGTGDVPSSGGFYTTPTIAVSATDAVTGASVGTTISYRFNGAGAFGTAVATATPGQVLDILVTNATTYHNAYINPFTATATSFPIPVKMYKNGTVTETMYSTTGVALTNGGGASNQSALGTGTTYNFKDEMTPQSGAPTPEMWCVVELSVGINASTEAGIPGVSYSLNGQPLQLVSQGAPVWYTVGGINSRVWIFDVPSLSAGATATFNLQVNGQGGSTPLEALPATAFVKKVCYTLEHFAYNGQHYFGVANGANTVQSLAQYSMIVY